MQSSFAKDCMKNSFTFILKKTMFIFDVTNKIEVLC